MHGDVSGVLQTPKTTKIGAVFLIIHYNRDLNTNWVSPAPRHFAKKCTIFFSQGNRSPEAAIGSYCMSSELSTDMTSTLHGAGAHAASASHQRDLGARIPPYFFQDL